MGKISFTTDMWSNFNKKAYMAVTAGEHLAEVFLSIIDCLKIAKKVFFLNLY